ncbi:hypothetical protein [Winogradskyella alexanderae]|uniref:Secreted protein n=1 Tax=Winogradskyella alexanderae TaxID=2877123 RepID=A0ABS7XSM0_9FLAO|nr:hypothetical protein [Winogradskyella alexanderae]MCA0131932.1 hypothetical protein [Winogradskyella alexanderae]
MSFFKFGPFTLFVFFIIFLAPNIGNSQKKRLKPPKRISKVTSVDLFVDKSFNLYNKIFVYDSLTQAGIDIPSELEDELTERAEQDLDSLWQLAPDIVDDISDASFMKQAKATLNLNKAKKALKYCGLIIKSYFIPEEED